MHNIHEYLYFSTNKENLLSQIHMIPHIHDMALLEIATKETLEIANFYIFIWKLLKCYYPCGEKKLRK